MSQPTVLGVGGSCLDVCAFAEMKIFESLILFKVAVSLTLEA